MSDDTIRDLADAAVEYTPDEDDDANGAPRQLAYGSDVEIARHVGKDLSSRYGDVIFCEANFWQYAGTHWCSIAGHELRLAVQRYDGTPFGQKGTVKLSKTRIDSIIHEMGAMLAEPDFFKLAPIGINCASGFIRFAKDGTPSLVPHDPEHRCRHVLKGKWDGSLTTDEVALAIAFSLLGQLLQGAFRGDPDADQKVMLLQEIAGVAAIGYGTKLIEPKAVILKGETADNGKSQILDLLRGQLPPDAVASISPAKMSDEHYLPQLIGKHLNATDELSSANAIASETFKAVVTGEPLTGRDLYRSASTFRPVAQHVFCTNKLPSFSGGMDRGVLRRLLVITFNRVIPKEERVEHIGLRIGEELPDLLLAWAVEGASRAIRQRDFTIPPSSKAALHNWLHSVDPVVAWARECVTVVEPDAPEWTEAKIKRAEAHKHFSLWSTSEGYQANKLPAANSFVERLHAYYPTIEAVHMHDGNWLVGLQIKGVDPAGPL
jgi:putative DNA primase/helicase